MKNLLSKSEENYEAFHILKDAKKYSSCMHCAYYSAFQLTIHVLTDKFGFDMSFLIDHKKDSHRTVISEMCNTMENELGLESLFYKTTMEKLKKIRSAADYTMSEFGFRQALKIEGDLNEVVTFLKSKCL